MPRGSAFGSEVLMSLMSLGLPAESDSKEGPVRAPSGAGLAV